ncbi:hypothetical protein CCUS01_00217 [Colletotrichum cuscutae]|uniref:Uncharacterized protein n=1 Tax=Colletotrichum cuscutae TaxID=1209917 RepID=A0AAI9YE00_9PEZI|nr:hypothetical protein CCUS01_00217 [Colletotrichum cuscutae]
MICRTSEDDLFKKANISRGKSKLRKKASKAYALSKGQRSQVRKAMEAIREGFDAALQKASLKTNLPLRQLPKTRGDVIFSYYLLALDEIDTWTSIQDAEDDSDNTVDMDNPFDAREAIKRTRPFITRKSTLLEGEVTISRLNIGFVDFLCPRTVGLYDTKSDHLYEGHKVKVQFINDDYLNLDLDSTIFADNSGPESPWPSTVKPVRRSYGVTKTKARSRLDQRTWEGGGTSQEERTQAPPRDRKTECKLANLMRAHYKTRYFQWNINV